MNEGSGLHSGLSVVCGKIRRGYRFKKLLFIETWEQIEKGALIRVVRVYNILNFSSVRDGISGLTEWLLAFQDRLSTVELLT
jgi:hypothetical protein